MVFLVGNLHEQTRIWSACTQGFQKEESIFRFSLQVYFAIELEILENPFHENAKTVQYNQIIFLGEEWKENKK